MEPTTHRTMASLQRTVFVASKLQLMREEEPKAPQNQAMLLLLPDRVLELGLGCVGVHECQMNKWSEGFRKEVFHWHCGSSPTVLSRMWFDLQQGGHLSEKQNTCAGFKRHCIAHFFLWTCPKNAGLMATRFNTCRKHCCGKMLWDWIGKIMALMPAVIKWDDSLGDPDKSPFVGTTDCTDCGMWEKSARHHFNTDKSCCSKKKNRAGLKHETVLDTTQSKCLSVVGPHKAKEHDMNAFREETKAKMLEMKQRSGDKMSIGDSICKPGRKACHRDEVGMFSVPDSLDAGTVKNFKSRSRCRHESFNGRLKCFGFLQQDCRGVDVEKHGTAFRAICTIVQCQMDLGSPLFPVN